MRYRWMLGLACVLGTTLAGLTGCGGDSNPTDLTCTPACSVGYTCVRGACVTACNPACGAGQVCVATAGGTMCVAGDGGTPPPDGTVMDSGVDPDVTIPPADSTVPMDTGAPPTDTGTAPGDAPPGDAGPPPCGNIGQPCCGDPMFPSSCRHGAECLGEYVTVMGQRRFRGTTCRAVTPVTGECARTPDCPTGQVCFGPLSTPRWHFSCQAATGTGALGTNCMNSTQCATGLCVNGRCSFTCAVGSAGDADCATRAPGYACAQGTYRTDLSMTTASQIALGLCVQTCATESACPAGFGCAPSIVTSEDRFFFACSQSAGMRTGRAGASCNPFGESTCQSALCLDVSTADSGPRGVCTAPCRTDTDCPASMTCTEIGFFVPSGRTAPFRGCYPR